MSRFTKLVIILLGITFLAVSNISGNINADNSGIKSPIPAAGLKLKAFRGDTAYAIELFVNEWIKNNPGIHIYLVQSHSTTLGSRILYIWYK